MLRLMLGEHSRIAAPHPPHILEHFEPLLHSYGDLKNKGAFLRLIADVRELILRNPVPWDHIATIDAVREHCRRHDLYAVFEAFYELSVEGNAAFWSCKSMSNVHRYAAMEKFGIRPLYIHLYRDGRDVAVSFRQVPVGPKHVYAVAAQWRRDQEAALAIFGTLGPERVLRVAYEDLLRDPEIELKRICDFAGLDYEPGMLLFYTSEHSRHTAEGGAMWRNVTRPVMKENHDKFRSALSPDDIGLFQAVAGDILQKLGYALLKGEAFERSAPGAAEVEAFLQADARLREETIRGLSAADREKRMRQSDWLLEIRSRMPKSS